MKQEIKPATGRLGVLVVGVGGAVATTMIVGTLASRKGLAKPIGSITQLATMRMENNEEKLIKDVVPLTDLNDIVFGGWDIFPDNAYEAAMYAEVLKEKDLNGVKDELEAIKPMPAAFDHNWAKRLNGTHIKKAATRWEMVEQLRQDIRDFKAANNCERVVVLWAASTEIYIPLSDEHMSLAALEKAMKDNNTEVISPSMCYAYAAIAEDAPFVMGAPNLCVDTPAMWEFSKQKNVPISGKDFKSGQTLMKTVLAPMFKTRMLGVNGWFSTNILGNREQKLLGKVPLFGVCLGHQLLALADGGKTYKLKYGHRGANQPVRDLEGVRTYITTQNHGYAVDADTLRQGKLRFVNINDGSCEGIDYPQLRAFSVQFHPVLGSGSQDAMILFDRFVDLMKGGEQ